MRQTPGGDQGHLIIYPPACLLDWLLLITNPGLNINIYRALLYVLWCVIPVACGGVALNDIEGRQVLRAYWLGVGTITCPDKFFKNITIPKESEYQPLTALDYSLSAVLLIIVLILVETIQADIDHNLTLEQHIGYIRKATMETPTQIGMCKVRATTARTLRAWKAHRDAIRNKVSPHDV